MTPSLTLSSNAAPNRARSSLLLPEVHAWAMERPMLVAAGLTKGMTVLDLGCGDGTFTRFLAGEVGPTGAVHGIDTDDVAIALAGAAASRSAVPLHYSAASAYDTGLPDDSVDFVFARHLFQALTDPARALDEIRRVLKPGGRVCLVDTHDGLLWLDPEPPGHADFMERADAQQRLRGGDRQIGRKLAALLCAARFEDVRTDVSVFDTGRLPVELFVGMALEPLRAVFPGDDAAEADHHLAMCEASLMEGGHGSAGFYATYARLP